MTALGELRPDDDRCAVRFERLFDFTPEEVWRALTDPEQLPGWLGHVSRWTLAAGEEYELDVGGPTTGRIVTLRPGRLLELTWRYGDEPESLLRLEVLPREHGCLLVLDHSRLDRANGPGYGAGWHAHLEGLALHLAGRQGDWDGRYLALRPAYEDLVRARLP